MPGYGLNRPDFIFATDTVGVAGYRKASGQVVRKAEN